MSGGSLGVLSSLIACALLHESGGFRNTSPRAVRGGPDRPRLFMSIRATPSSGRRNVVQEARGVRRTSAVTDNGGGPDRRWLLSLDEEFARAAPQATAEGL